ncbi:MAG TPA: DUF11 domain-containing protein, partial [Anaerolineae bacterium]|nr:DUF11 domain-containing protein [Anaerolineae bacterium]
SRVVLVLIVQALLLLMGAALASAGASAVPERAALVLPVREQVQSLFAPPGTAAARLQPLPVTTLQVAIVSSPWATLDHNNPAGGGEPVPHVFVVEAVVTNVGSTTAHEVVVALDYQENPADNWVLLPGEDLERAVDELAPGAAYHAYWFARYSTVIGASHQYTVRAEAQNAATVATSDNAYGNPEPGKTVKTRSSLSTGNSGVSNVSAEISVGVAFTVTVRYDLGTNPLGAQFSPVGNVDFDAGSYQLLSSRIRLYNDAGTQESTVADRLYLASLPLYAQNAEAVYTFIAKAPADTRLCAYTSLGYQSSQKYDQFFCEEHRGTVVHIGGTLSFAMNKKVSSLVTEQNRLLAYTIHYTNEATLPLTYAWIWDDVDTGIGSVVPGSIAPAPDANETTAGRVAWYLGNIPAAGQPGSTGILAFTLLVDGDGHDLADGTNLVNLASFGINPGLLPPRAALTDTTATLVQAPAVTVAKSDGREWAEPGQQLVYSLRVTNTGSLPATGLVVADQLPAEVVYISGSASPPESSRTGQSLTWTNLGPLPPGDADILITVPVQVAIVPDATQLRNTATVSYQNSAGWSYEPRSATDLTMVSAPILAIAKSDAPDPVLVGRLITYTLSWTNTGPAAATNVVVTDSVPLNTTFNACQGACSLNAGVVRWNVGSLAANSSESVRFSVRVDDSLPSGTEIWNDDYGLTSDQSGVVTGPPVSTQVLF